MAKAKTTKQTKKSAKAKKPSATKKTNNAKSKKKPTRKPIDTIVGVIFDESGSMQSQETKVVSAFNEYIGSLRNNKTKDKLFVSLTKFNDQVNVVYTDRPIEDVIDLNAETYRPSGLTALYDAIGKTVNAITQAIKGKEDKTAVLVIVITDGAENASREFTQQQILALIKEKEGLAIGPWNFVFLAANQDAFGAGASIGMRAVNTMNISTQNMSADMGTLSKATQRYRGFTAASASVGETKNYRMFTEEENKKKNV